MNRHARSFALLTGTLALVMGCSGGAEEQVLEDFFRASRMRDNTTLGNFATVGFDPRTDGVVQSFNVVSVSEERTRPLPLKQYAQELADARAKEEELSKQKLSFQNANIAVIQRVTKDGARVTPRDKAVADEWAKWSADAAASMKAVSQAQRQLNNSKGLAELSLVRTPAAGKIEGFNGELVSKDLVIDATVRQPDGATVQKNFKVTLSRARMKNTDGSDIDGRWILTNLVPA
jgi:hypothetical protein